MKITEVLASSQMWAKLKQIELNTYNKLVEDYQILEQIISAEKTLDSLGTSFNKSPTSGSMAMKVEFKDKAHQHINKLKNIGIPDPDIDNQITHLTQLIQDLS